MYKNNAVFVPAPREMVGMEVWQNINVSTSFSYIHYKREMTTVEPIRSKANLRKIENVLSQDKRDLL